MPTFSEKEIEKFNAISSCWWDLKGHFKPLHKINQPRLQFIKKNIDLNNKKALDVGCGGGILAESLAKSGARVTAIDMAEDVINVAKSHATENQLDIEYLHTSLDELLQNSNKKFDVVTCMEMLEHVENPQDIISACADALKPGGLLFISTINRNIRSMVTAIFGAEYLLNIIPRGTHSYRLFLKPSEIDRFSRSANLDIIDSSGISYCPITSKSKLCSNQGVNYICCYRK